MPCNNVVRNSAVSNNRLAARLCTPKVGKSRPVQSWSSGTSSSTLICPDLWACRSFIDGTADWQPPSLLASVAKSSTTDTRLIAVQKSPLFSGLSLGTSRCIACHGRLQNVSRGEAFFRQGDAGSRIFLITAGQAKVTRAGHSGEVVILWLRGPGGVLGGLSLAPGTRNETGAQATEDCQLMSWDARAMQAFTQHSATLQQNTVSLLTACLDSIQERFYELATDKVAIRLARNLIRMYANAVRSAGEVLRIGLTREELAQMTGTTLFAVSRLLCDWTRRGIIDARREEVYVFDISKLRELVKDKA